MFFTSALRTSGLLRPQLHKSSTTLDCAFGGWGNVSRGKTRFSILSSCVLIYTSVEGEIRSFRVRLYIGFITETQVSANRCGKHLCMLRFRKCGLAETHSLNSRIRKFSETAELLLSAIFPLSVNSTDKQQSNSFPQQIKRTVACYDTLENVRIRKQNFLFLFGNPVGRWMFNSGETQ